MTPLPGPVVKAFLLSQLDGLKQAGIATELKLPLATAQRYIAKAADPDHARA